MQQHTLWKISFLPGLVSVFGLISVFSLSVIAKRPTAEPTANKGSSPDMTHTEGYDFQQNEIESSLTGGSVGNNRSVGLVNLTREQPTGSAGMIQLWNTTIPWTLSPLFNSTEAPTIQAAVKHWQDNTCLTLTRVSETPDRPHVHFVKSTECSSQIGVVGGGRQEIHLGPKCFTMGKIAHEIGHVLGLQHEHSRPDRDRYVTVMFDQVMDGFQPNFDIVTWDRILSAGTPYDYGSAMHYRSTSFSKFGNQTLIPKETGYEGTIGQREAMSFYDFKLANNVYCPHACNGLKLKWSKCENDGYRNPRQCSTCACPEGFRPPFCSNIQHNDLGNCGRAYRYSDMYSRGVITSPSYPSGYPGPGSCYWILMTYVGTAIVFSFDQTSSLRCDEHTCRDYVEIRSGDLARTGQRYCCGFPKTDIHTSGSRVLIIFRSQSANKNNPGFKLRYHSEPCGGCLYPYPRFQRACQNTVTSLCKTNYTSPCKNGVGGLCLSYHSNTCYEKIFTCCRGYRLSGETCKNIRGPWDEWSVCVTRGVCETQTRRRRICLIKTKLSRIDKLEHAHQ